MQKAEKFLSKLKTAERVKAIEIVARVENGDIAGLDFKRLKGNNKLFRVRFGENRLIFQQFGKTFRLIYASKRDNRTYKGL
jgi:mRNA-degrading endonuclease RelE of RelBE toxin-antitoxin system